MAAHEEIYVPPAVEDVLPEEVVRCLDGSDLETKAKEAIRISTVDSDGWPHAAQVSAGEMLAVSGQEILLAIWPDSSTSKNLRRDRRLTLAFAHQGALLESRCIAELVAEGQKLSIFRITVKQVNVHRSQYAEVVSGIVFRLHDPSRTIKRWKEQIAVLKSFVKS